MIDLLLPENGTPGIYRSSLVAGGWDKPEPVILVGEEDDGWWFYLPESWPFAGWRADTRWFSQRNGASFVPARGNARREGD